VPPGGTGGARQAGVSGAALGSDRANGSTTPSACPTGGPTPSPPEVPLCLWCPPAPPQPSARDPATRGPQSKGAWQRRSSGTANGSATPSRGRNTLVLPEALPLLHLVSPCACGCPRSSPAKRPRPGYQGPNRGQGEPGRGGTTEGTTDLCGRPGCRQGYAPRWDTVCV
jgi:hypothetical protein